jgi:hypothetical protein
MNWPGKEVEGMEKEVSVILSAIFTSRIYCNELTWNPCIKNL